MTTEEEAEQRTYAEVTRGFTKKEECKLQMRMIKKKKLQKDGPPRRFRFQNQQPTMEINQEENYRRTTPFRRSPQVSNYFSWFMLFL
jgi:hypothetical protein